MKKILKNQAGAAIVVIILVLVLAVAGGGAAFLTVRMIVTGDGNFLQPFEELGWIDPKEDDSSNDKEDKDTSKKQSKDEKKDKKEDDDDKDKVKDKKDDKKDDKKNDDKKETDDKKTSSKKSDSKNDYLVEEKRLSTEAKKSDTKHYHGSISLADEIDASDDEYAELYDLMKAGINLYAKDGKVIEIEFGFDITDFCKEAFDKFPDEFETAGMTSANDLQDMMMSMLETMFDSFDEEYSDYISRYTDGGKFQLYVTEKGFESLYETYGIEDGENDVDTFIEALEDSFNTKIELVK